MTDYNREAAEKIMGWELGEYPSPAMPIYIRGWFRKGDISSRGFVRKYFIPLTDGNDLMAVIGEIAKEWYIKVGEDETGWYAELTNKEKPNLSTCTEGEGLTLNEAVLKAALAAAKGGEK